ncbi:Protein-lysine N-methyltransferase efm6 [Aspergillus melleus]|uniref:Protein-lysine N-methyltransferase efm6 n=1 Tax=Aspergillus melleus TaxID=138277 RepID=A0ACC3BHL7_9EURO|nr:Protein-lysine N-methyltransferase efm6 [Aspergillus melleus]
MEQPDDRLPAPDGLNDDFEVSESLVPMRDLKAAEQNTVSFDGLLAEPLILKEDLKEGCGGQLWPAAGGGLVGLAVARGCNIGKPPLYITDQAPMLPLMETNIKINNLASTVVAGVLNWGEPIPDLIPSHPAVILAADCVYFEPAFPLLISTLVDLLGPGSVCYFCFKRRRRADLRFMKMARKAFEVDIVTDDPDAEANVIGSESTAQPQ